MLNVDKAIEELNEILINAIESTIKIADKYDIDRNSLLEQMGKKIHLATEISDFSTYELDS